MNPDNTQIIFGPPGTGKTTALLQEVESLLSAGADPHLICFVTFTRKAASEAINRAMDKFRLEREDLPLFRTLHSLAFRHTGRTRRDMMGFPDYISIAKSLGLFLTARGLQEDGTIVGMSLGDRLMFMSMMSRARMMGLKEYWEQYPDEDIDFDQLDLLHRTVQSYRENNEKYDFTDLIEMFCDNEHYPPCQTLIVDEAQDLSPLQWRMVKCLASSAERVVIAGDDDQAIYGWAGADVGRLIECPGTQRVLTRSYRCPKNIQDVALEISSRIGHRVSKVWAPREGSDTGEVQHVASLADVDLSSGQWLLLARNVFMLERLGDHCRSAGYVYDSPLGSPTRGPMMEAIVTWEQLRKGRSVAVRDVLGVYDLMSSRVGVAYGMKTALEREPEARQVTMDDLRQAFGLMTTAIWHEALDRIPDSDREYYIAALKQGEKLTREPRIRISTIHGVKGGEADNVLVMTDMARRTYQEMEARPDDEHRVWYVAVTRARERLYIMRPETPLHYDI